MSEREVAVSSGVAELRRPPCSTRAWTAPVDQSGAEPFAHFLASTGHRVIRGAGALWYDASPGFFLSVPSHRPLRPTREQIAEVLRHQPCAGLRFPAPLTGPGKLSYQIVCDRADYGIEGLSANARSKVRRGLRRCVVRPISFAAIAAEGRRADRDTLARQGRAPRVAASAWEAFWAAAAATSGMEAWAAYVGGTLAAFLVAVQFEDAVELLLARSRSDYLDAYPNNALVYTVTSEMLVRRGVRQVTFGLESLEPVGALDQFKFGMGFRCAPIRQRVVFHPALRALLALRPIRTTMCRLTSGRPGGFWRKARGLVQFAEAGGEFAPAASGGV